MEKEHEVAIGEKVVMVELTADSLVSGEIKDIVELCDLEYNNLDTFQDMAEEEGDQTAHWSWKVVVPMTVNYPNHNGENWAELRLGLQKLEEELNLMYENAVIIPC